MNKFSRVTAGLGRVLRSPGPRGVMSKTGAVTVFAVAATIIVTPPAMPSQAAILSTYYADETQSVAVTAAAAPVAVVRENYSATPGVDTLVAGGTNADWAKLVLLDGGWEMSENNVTVILRWMRQENGPENWFNRNNPLNNGWGSGGGGGTGTYANLQVAAAKAAEALHGNAGYAGIVAALAASADTAVTESAIWASPWASGHYANGGHWHYTPVKIVMAPASAWG